MLHDMVVGPPVARSTRSSTRWDTRGAVVGHCCFAVPILQHGQSIGASIVGRQRQQQAVHGVTVRRRAQRTYPVDR